ncbi:hypothetical protein NP493_403g00029 [Ridgeia piscesae]|uniref:DDE Tnp4 domain-containing protein n=1 Tax=Ridgeia piscesae TaxID=27915 RepID=A0AAD9NUN4_RIDPI|nr:hypothetical protein NP493_403g00029 [Ridgeia piscesae]
MLSFARSFVSDAGVYAASSLAHAFEVNTLNIPPAKPLPGRQKEVPYVVVGDAAFGMKEHFIRLFRRGT